MTTATCDGDVSLEVLAPVATISLDRPHKRNALRIASWRALPGLIAAAEEDPEVGVIILRGAGGHFSAGNDIAEMTLLPGDPAAAEALARAMAAAMQSIEEAVKPVLIAIEGACYGAAVALALAGDIRIASTEAEFAVTPAKLGAVYLRSDLHRLANAVGLGQSKKLIYSAEPIGAARAAQIGLVDDLVCEGDFEAGLRRWVDTILAGSPSTLRSTKRQLHALALGRTPRETSESLAVFVDATQSSEFSEGVGAFLARRTPHFRREATALRAP